MTAPSSGKPVVLLVHGAWHGAWCWELLVPELTALGWQVETVDLPSASADPSNTAGMYDDARAVRRGLDAVGGPVTVLAHSYAGLPVTEAAAGAEVARLVYLAAFQLDVGDSLAGIAGGGIPSGDTGTLPAHEDPRTHLYADVLDEIATRAADRLVLQTVKSFSEPLTTAAWKTVPSSYVVCEQDRAIDPGFQKVMATRSERSYTLPTGHSPFYSAPGELARLITADADL
ncbi:alpha/beta fold hydrolase [Streptomyces anthocyanicus]|uniref:alpha/beta fold hydrolase n=1 Tax=Streptomyces anthocyanicus TaxID=68174 RepID=UPI002F906A08|nr:alpha/beta hydrolase [Streptomyces anthocyanicus]